MTEFNETQAFAVWGYAVLGVTTVISLGGLAVAPRISNWLWLYVGASLARITNLLCLRTTVDDREVIVSLGALFPLYRRRIWLADIAAARADTYAPLAEYGGWGIRGWGKNVALNARGDRGVRLMLTDGRRVLVGSQRAEELAAALGAK